METAFAFVAGSPVLDLAGTVGRRRTAPLELLRGPEDFGRWLVAAGLAERQPPVLGWEFVAAVELREAAYRLACATVRGEPLAAGDRGVVNAVAAGLPLAQELGADGRLRHHGSPAQALATLARGAVELLAGPDAGRVRECAWHDCTRLYLDRSAGGGRRWCDMRRCGNRAKAAEFRARKAE